MRVIGALVLSFVFCCLLSLSPARAQIDVDVSVDVAPPPLPVYDQPAIPAPGYIWTPGYWAWDDATGYYWVPGTWVLPPEPELLWTPGYWGWDNGAYLFHGGYWGPQIGFYGGVPYGFGYTGYGYEGGYWRGGAFFYNRSVNNIGGVAISNVYNRAVEMRNSTNVSYNGGAGGIEARPTPEQIAAGKEHHVGATAEQTQHMQTAARDPALSLNNNHGHPTIAATGHPGQLSGAGIVAAHPGTPVAAIAPQGHHVGGPGVPGNHALPGVQPGAPGTKVGTGNAATAPGNHALPGVQPGAPGTKVGTGNAATAPGNHALPGVAPAHGGAPAGGSPVANTHPGTEMHEMHNGAGSGTPPAPHVGGAPATTVHTPTAAVHPQSPAPSVARPTPAAPPVHAVKPPSPPPARVAAPAPHPAPPPHPAPKPAPPPKPKCQPGQHC